MLDVWSLILENGLNQEVNVSYSLSSCLHSSKDSGMSYKTRAKRACETAKCPVSNLQKVVSVNVHLGRYFVFPHSLKNISEFYLKWAYWGLWPLLNFNLSRLLYQVRCHRDCTTSPRALPGMQKCVCVYMYPHVWATAAYSVGVSSLLLCDS